MTLEPPFDTPAYKNYKEQLEEKNKKKKSDNKSKAP